MPDNIKKIILKKKIDGVIADLYPKTSADYVVNGETTVSAQLAEFATALESISTSAQVDAKIQTATTNLYNQIMGITEQDSTTVTEAYDTLKEVAAYINSHGSVVEGFTSDISALKTAVGTAEAGLVKKVADLESTVSGLDYSKVTASKTNGNITIDGTDVTVYTEPVSIDATKIDTDATHRFITDDQLTGFAAKSTVNVVSELPAEVNTTDLYLVIEDDETNDQNPSAPTETEDDQPQDSYFG